MPRGAAECLAEVRRAARCCGEHRIGARISARRSTISLSAYWYCAIALVRRFSSACSLAASRLSAHQLHLVSVRDERGDDQDRAGGWHEAAHSAMARVIPLTPLAERTVDRSVYELRGIGRTVARQRPALHAAFAAEHGARRVQRGRSRLRTAAPAPRFRRAPLAMPIPTRGGAAGPARGRKSPDRRATPSRS